MFKLIRLGQLIHEDRRLQDAIEWWILHHFDDRMNVHLYQGDRHMATFWGTAWFVPEKDVTKKEGA